MQEEVKISDGKQFIIIGMEKDNFAIDISYIESIERMQKITRVPKSQDYFHGIINLRGEIIPVMSLRRKMGLEDLAFDDKTRIIIAKIESKHSVGLIVDSVMEVITLEKDNIEKAVSTINDDKNSKYIYGIGKYKDKLISLLELPTVVLE